MEYCVIAKNLPSVCNLNSYNGMSCLVVYEVHSRRYGTSLRVRFADGKEITLSPGQYETSDDVLKRYDQACRNEIVPFVGPGLARIQRYSARCTT
jgi:hypothetical protein